MSTTTTTTTTETARKTRSQGSGEGMDIDGAQSQPGLFKRWVNVENEVSRAIVSTPSYRVVLRTLLLQKHKTLVLMHPDAARGLRLVPSQHSEQSYSLHLHPLYPLVSH